MAPGILYVTMQPKPELPREQFEDWYNNEHGPLRLRLSFCKNGFRYRASDLDDTGRGLHEWMAVYDMADLEGLNGDEYKKLRGPPVQTQRETDLRPYLDIDRKSFDFIREWKVQDYRPLETLQSDNAGNVVVAILLTLKPDQDPTELDRWYNDEHVGLLQKVPGWQRTRRFKTSSVDPRPVTEYLALHEYSLDNGLGGPEFQAAITTPFSKHIYSSVIASRHRRTYSHYYTFAPAPRHISSVSNWSSPATLTRSLAPSASTPYSAIESYISLPDGATLQYRLEGCPSPSAPVVLCINSILTPWTIWSPFTHLILSAHPTHRVLRFLPRGRTSSFGTTDPITLTTLTNDVLLLLDTLRIPSPALTIGVSLGGATALSLALRHPARIPAFVACDTNAAAPASNPTAWGERLAVAEADDSGLALAASAGEDDDDPFAATDAARVVGDALAAATVERWFPATSRGDPALQARIRDVQEGVARNSLSGFKAGVRALYEYDLAAELGGCRSRGLLVVGGEDGKVPASMEGMAAWLGDGRGGTGVQLVVVEGAGHLPMVDRVEDVVAAVERMLG